MASNAWIYMALGAAVMWGFAYAMSEKIVHHGFSPAFVLVVSYSIGLPLYFLFAWHNGTLAPGFKTLTSSWPVLWQFGAMALSIAMGNLLVYYAIAAKNATLASMIEITYPVFTFIFAWLLMGQVQLTLATAFGALLIFAGVAVMFFKG